jgi:hypothetical protein
MINPAADFQESLEVFRNILEIGLVLQVIGNDPAFFFCSIEGSAS